MPLVPISKLAFEQDEVLRAELEDTQRCMAAMRQFPEFSILRYIYSNKHEQLVCIAGHHDHITIGKLTDPKNDPLSLEYLMIANEAYNAVFRQDTYREDRPHADIFDSRLLPVWYDLYLLFIAPVKGIFKGNGLTTVLTTFTAGLFPGDIFFNIPLLYDLNFRFSKQNDNIPLYFYSVSNGAILEHFDGMMRSGYPEEDRMFILNGYEHEYERHRNNARVSAGRRSAILFRENLLDRIFKHLQEKGARIKQLRQLEDWNEPLSNTNKFNFILLLTHFHYDTILLPDNLFISFSDLLRYVMIKQDAGMLKSDIILDAITCDNFGEFSKLRKSGISYVHMSMNNISIDLSIYILGELCFGSIAGKLGWPFPYLNGKRRLYTIYSDIYRAMYVQMKLENVINLSVH